MKICRLYYTLGIHSPSNVSTSSHLFSTLNVSYLTEMIRSRFHLPCCKGSHNRQADNRSSGTAERAYSEQCFIHEVVGYNYV